MVKTPGLWCLIKALDCCSVKGCDFCCPNLHPGGSQTCGSLGLTPGARSAGAVKREWWGLNGSVEGWRRRGVSGSKFPCRKFALWYW